MDNAIAGGIPECRPATRYRCERPSNGCRRAVERVLKARCAVVKPGVKNSNYRVSRRNRIAPRPDDHGRHSGVPRAAPCRLSPRPFPGSNGSTVARSSSLKSNPAMAAAFSRWRTGNPNERRENDEPGSRPDGNSDWLLSHASYRSETPSALLRQHLIQFSTGLTTYRFIVFTKVRRLDNYIGYLIIREFFI